MILLTLYLNYEQKIVERESDIEKWQITVNRGGTEHVLKADKPLSVQLVKITKD